MNRKAYQSIVAMRYLGPFLQVFFLLFALSSSLISTESFELGEPLIRNFDHKETESHPQTWAILQDHRGIMYIGGLQGLLEYDGRTWRKTYITNQSVRSLAMNSAGTIYIGLANDFGMLQYTPQGLVDFISFVPLLPKSEQIVNSIFNIFITSHGVYYITFNKLYGYYQNKVKVWDIDFSINGAVIQDKLYIPQKTGGILVFHNGKKHLYPNLRKLFNPESDGALCIFPYSEKKLLFVSEQKGLYLADIDDLFSSREVENPLKPMKSKVKEYLRQNTLYCGLKLQDNRFALGTKQGGIVIFNSRGKITQVINRNRGLHDNYVLTLTQDKCGNLWAGLNLGISHIELSSPLTRFGEKSGITGSLLAVEKFKDKLYIGGFFGIFVLGTHSVQMRGDSYKATQLAGYNDSAWDFIKYQDRLLVSGSGGVFDITNIEKVTPLTQRLPAMKCAQSSKFPHHIFVGTGTGISVIKDEENGNFSNLGSLKGVNVSVFIIETDPEGNLWFPTRYQGLNLIKFTGTSPLQFTLHKFDHSRGLPIQDMAFCTFRDNRIIASSFYGLFISDRPPQNMDHPDAKFQRENTFGKFFNLHGFPLAQIYPLSQNSLLLHSWTGFGTVTLRPNNHPSMDFETLRAVEGNILDLFKENDILWMPTDRGEGLFRYDSTIKKNYQKQYNCLIRKVSLDENRVIFYGSFPGEKKNNTRLNQSREQIPTLPYKSRSLTFLYAAAFYESSYNLKFQTRLKGYITDWSSWGEGNKREYTNLNEGEYNFEVRAKNIYDHISSTAVYSFSILPPWYRTWWAFTGYGLILLSIMVTAFFYHHRQISDAVIKERKKHEKLYLTTEMIEEYMQKLLSYMKREKPYLESDLNLNKLSNGLGIPRYQLSYIINSKLNQTFFEFLSHYRIKEAMIKLADPHEEDTSILDIAYAVGFNSKSSFNTAFKKQTQLTPLKYKKKMLDKSKHDK